MRLIIRFESGVRVEAVLLAAGADAMRIIPSQGNTLELVRMGDSWYTEQGDLAEIEALIATPGIDVAQSQGPVRPQHLAAGSSYSVA